MSDNPTNKDGVERMWARFRREAKQVKRVLNEQEGSHDPYTNFWVESCRHGPYLTGHLLAWFMPVLLVALVWGWLR
jgi:hypothetical protein